MFKNKAIGLLLFCVRFIEVLTQQRITGTDKRKRGSRKEINTYFQYIETLIG